MSIPKFVRKPMVGFKTRKMKKALRNSQALAYKLGGGAREYNQRMTAHRKWMDQEIQKLYARLKKRPDLEKFLYLYLIYFSAIGSHMVAKANVWLTTWGEAFSNLGCVDIGEDYIRHAKGEIGHDQWHRNDVKTLIGIYEQRYGKALNIENILQEGHAACVRRYYELSEKTVSGADSYLSLGELYETEIMALDQAPSFIGFCVTELGFNVLKGLSFLRGHVISDIEHIRDNIEQMESYLKKYPQHLDSIEHAGRETIEIYVDYFNQAFNLAETKLYSLGV